MSVAGKDAPGRAGSSRRALDVAGAYLSQPPGAGQRREALPAERRGVIVVFPTGEAASFSSDATASVGGIKLDAPERSA